MAKFVLFVLGLGLGPVLFALIGTTLWRWTAQRALVVEEDTPEAIAGRRRADPYYDAAWGELEAMGLDAGEEPRERNDGALLPVEAGALAAMKAVYATRATVKATEVLVDLVGPGARWMYIPHEDAYLYERGPVKLLFSTYYLQHEPNPAKAVRESIARAEFVHHNPGRGMH